MKFEKHLSAFSRLKRSPCAVLSSNLSTEQMIAVLRKDPAVEYVQPVYIRHIMERIPDDPMYSQQWVFPVISAPSAWGYTTGDSRFVVAVVDTGIDYTHPDIQSNIWINDAELHGLSGIDDDGNGYVDDIYGYNFGLDNSDPMDTNSHGTHVAGIIGAVSDNSLGVAGVNWTVKLMALNAFSGSFFSDGDLIEALSYAVIMKRDFGINIVAINASWGSSGGEDGDLLYQAIEETARAGIAFVAAAGNSGKNNDDNPMYPASYNIPNIIAVAASDEQDYLWSSSNYGSATVHLAAPGVNVLSTVPDAVYAHLSAGGSDYAAGSIEFSGITGENGISGTLIDCGLGYPGQIPPGVFGNIALIERGELYFSEKVANAQSAGAESVVIYNNIPDEDEGGGIINATLGSPGNWVPAVFVSMTDGLVLKQTAPVQETTVYNILLPSAYSNKSGTSMAAPFVSGAFALLGAYYPEEAIARNSLRIINSVEPMEREQDRDKLITGGRLNLAGAVEYTLPVSGDINGDGTINIEDVIKCLRMALELDAKDPARADVNGDWYIDISDVILLLRKAVGLE